jgi:serine/threonine protein kinase
VQVLDIQPPPQANFDDVYIISELMDTDLHRVIYSRQKLTDDHVQFFLYQMLCALKYMHSAKVIHRDLKPSNILLNSNCDLKLCDFGLSRGLTAGHEGTNDLTEYVVTRWYRAPEIMLSCQDYTTAIDVWSVGCIFGEMLGRKPLFPGAWRMDTPVRCLLPAPNPTPCLLQCHACLRKPRLTTLLACAGNDYIHQLKLITKLLGTPSLEELSFVTNQKARRFMQNLPKEPPGSLQLKYPEASADALDLLDKMLVINPAQRITVVQALEHPYLASLRDPGAWRSPCRLVMLPQALPARVIVGIMCDGNGSEGLTTHPAVLLWQLWRARLRAMYSGAISRRVS